MSGGLGSGRIGQCGERRGDRLIIVTSAQVQRQTWSDLPVILHKEAVIHRREVERVRSEALQVAVIAGQCTDATQARIAGTRRLQHVRHIVHDARAVSERAIDLVGSVLQVVVVHDIFADADVVLAVVERHGVADLPLTLVRIGLAVRVVR